MSPVDVKLIQASFRTCSVVTISLVNVSLLRPNEESCSFVIGKVQSRYGDFRRLIVTRMLQF